MHVVENVVERVCLAKFDLIWLVVLIFVFFCDYFKSLRNIWHKSVLVRFVHCSKCARLVFSKLFDNCIEVWLLEQCILG